jgi:peptide/nickel transport system ATP-binding protein/oligopeptide transport system ATP-binding protein|tara:strand:+ start:604 stop:1581 length:978 start_codon:yes stop_codon:yes gene_type:complete
VEPLLRVQNLSVSFETENGIVCSVRGVDLTVNPGEILALVGESGCGKSVTALSVLRLLPSPPALFESGSIHFCGKNLLELSESEMQLIRGNDIAMIFQEPMTSLNPILTIGDQIGETILLHNNISAKESRQRTLEILKKVAIPSPENRIDQYPHELSGGMKQRVMIAMAISCNPKLLIADEPTTALDVTIQAQILELLADLQQDIGMAILLITHNLGVVAEYANRVSVMYSGKIVEESRTQYLFETPAHPYSKGLLNSLPNVLEGNRLTPIPGVVPDPTELPLGCAFQPRCSVALPHCEEKNPTFLNLEEFKAGHKAACFLHEPA